MAKGTPMWLSLLPLTSMILVLFQYLLEVHISLYIAAIVILVLDVILLLFFRDFDRTIGEGVVSPADGKVLRVEKRGKQLFVSIFMNVYDVHVNRVPWDGIVLSLEHRQGGFAPAFSKGSDRNERLITKLGTDHGTWEITQIAGAVARRIVPYVKESDDLKKGQRMGMIRFGSRVDLLFRLPKGYVADVEPGDRVKAGTTDLAVKKVSRGAF